MHSVVSSNAEEAIEVGGVPFSMLDEETPIEDLRAFHEAEGLKCPLLKRMFPDEMYAAIAEVGFLIAARFLNGELGSMTANAWSPFTVAKSRCRADEK